MRVFCQLYPIKHDTTKPLSLKACWSSFLLIMQERKYKNKDKNRIDDALSPSTLLNANTGMCGEVIECTAS